MRVAVRRIIRGGVLGFVILGVGGRLMMAVYSALTPFPVGFSWRGSFAVAVTGALYGLAGGLLALPFAAWRRGRPTARDGALLGLLLLVAVVIISIGLRQVSAAWAFPVLTLILFTPLTIAFGIALARTEPRVTGSVVGAGGSPP